MSINLSLLLLAFLGAFAVGYGCMMDRESSFETGGFIYRILLIAGGFLAIIAAAFMRFVFSVI